MDPEDSAHDAVWHLRRFAALRNIAPATQLSDEFFNNMADHVTRTMSSLILVEQHRQSREIRAQSSQPEVTLGKSTPNASTSASLVRSTSQMSARTVRSPSLPVKQEQNDFQFTPTRPRVKIERQDSPAPSYFSRPSMSADPDTPTHIPRPCSPKITQTTRSTDHIRLGSAGPSFAGGSSQIPTSRYSQRPNTTTASYIGRARLQASSSVRPDVAVSRSITPLAPARSHSAKNFMVDSQQSPARDVDNNANITVTSDVTAPESVEAVASPSSESAMSGVEYNAEVQARIAADDANTAVTFNVTASEPVEPIVRAGSESVMSGVVQVEKSRTKHVNDNANAIVTPDVTAPKPVKPFASAIPKPGVSGAVQVQKPNANTAVTSNVTASTSITPVALARPESVMSGVEHTQEPQVETHSQPPDLTTQAATILSPLREMPSDGFASMSDPKRFKPSPPIIPSAPAQTPLGALLEKLANAKHAHEVSRLLRDDILPRRPIDARSVLPMPFSDAILDFVKDCIMSVWRHETEQAQAAWENRHGGKVKVVYQPLYKYCAEPEGYKEENLANSVKDIRRKRQQAQSMLLRARGIETWVMPLLEKREAQLRRAGKVKDTAEDLAFELVMGGIGETFPQSWRRQIEAEYWDDDELKLIVGSRTKESSSASRTFKWRKRNRYRCLEHLRENGLEYIFLSEAPKFDTLLGEITDPYKQLVPCAEIFKDFVKVLSLRAWSAAKDDFSGRTETTNSGLKGKTYGVVSMNEKAVWNNEAGFWASIGDCYLYNDTHVIPPIGTLPSSAAVFKYGYLGQAERNMAHFIMPYQTGSSIQTCAARNIQRGSFVGVLPTKCLFRPDQPATDKLFRGPENGLYMDDDGCKGLMSYMSSVEEFEKGNVVAAWDRYLDPKAPQLISWRLLLFAYQPVKFMQPLVLWNNMRGAAPPPKPLTSKVTVHQNNPFSI